MASKYTGTEDYLKKLGFIRNLRGYWSKEVYVGNANVILYTVSPNKEFKFWYSEERPGTDFTKAEEMWISLMPYITGKPENGWDKNEN